MWLMLLNAMSRLRSVWRMVTTAPYSMLITAIVASSHAYSCAVPGNIPTAMRIIP